MITKREYWIETLAYRHPLVGTELWDCQHMTFYSLKIFGLTIWEWWR